jgi:hypothetical protein
MNRRLLVALTIVLVFGAMPILAAPTGSITKNYPNVTLSGGFQSGNFIEPWNLTTCDLEVTTTVDLTGMVDAFGPAAHAFTQFGVRQAGGSNYNPTVGVQGKGVWLATDYDSTANTFAPDPPDAPTWDIDDKLILERAGGGDESYYNLPSTPPNPGSNYGIWFDRDGVDPFQAVMWGSVNGGTYNTGGRYDVVMRLHANSATAGTAYVTINGIQQGFYVPDWHPGQPDIYPAGMTFTGNMTQMQVFYGLSGFGATHTVHFEDTTVTGCLAPCSDFGDFNCNYVIDVSDIMEEASRWGCFFTQPCYRPWFDLDPNQVIDAVDIMKLAVHWGELWLPGSVP